MTASRLIADRIKNRLHPVDCDAVVPGGELAGAVESGPQVMGRDGTEPAIPQIVLTRPDDFDRTTSIFRQEHRIENEVRVPIAAPAEAASQQHVIELDVAAVYPEKLRRRFTRDGLALRSTPYLDCIPVGDTEATAFNGSSCAWYA